MSEEAADEAQVKRQKRFEHLNKMAATFTALSTSEVIALSTASAILTTFGPDRPKKPFEVLDIAESCFPPVDKVFNDDLFSKPLIPTTILRNVCEFNEVTPITDEMLNELNIGDLRTFSGGLVSLIWLGSLLSLSVNKLRQIIEQRHRSSSISHSLICKTEPQHNGASGRLTSSNRFVIHQASRDDLADRVQNLELLVQRSSQPLE